MVKAVLERGVQTELTEYLGYDKGDPVGHSLPIARNGFSNKSVSSEVGDVPLAIPRDHDGTPFGADDVAIRFLRSSAALTVTGSCIPQPKMSQRAAIICRDTRSVRFTRFLHLYRERPSQSNSTLAVVCECGSRGGGGDGRIRSHISSHWPPAEFWCEQSYAVSVVFPVTAATPTARRSNADEEPSDPLACACSRQIDFLVRDETVAVRKPRCGTPARARPPAPRTEEIGSRPRSPHQVSGL